MSAQLSINHLSKRFQAGTVNEKHALHDFSLQVESGDFLTILGSNGAGKSTLFNAIMGKFLPDSGSICLGGKDITYWKDFQRARYIGYLFQDPLRGTAPSMTIEENLALAYRRQGAKSLFAVNRRDSAYFRELLASLELGLEDRMKTRMGLLSGGQRQAAALVMAVIANPELLLLDEHTAALDVATSEKVLHITRRIIQERKLTTLMITHNIQQALEFGNRTIVMDSGRIILDIHGQQRQEMTVRGLTELFFSQAEQALSDRALFSLGQ
jgi:putative ABC transport system ATP-binding protein